MEGYDTSEALPRRRTLRVVEVEHRNERRVVLGMRFAFLAGALACSGPRQIVPADLAVRSDEAPKVERDGLELSAAVLDRQHAERYLHVDVAARHVLPVTFRLGNETGEPLRLGREDFLLRVEDRWDLNPALPGRAAAMLRDPSGSQGAALAGFIILSAFAAPVIHNAEQHEAEAVEANRALVFASATIPPGESVAGYLLFECPVDVDNVTALELRLVPVDGSGTEGRTITLRLVNPYAD